MTLDISTINDNLDRNANNNASISSDLIEKYRDLKTPGILANDTMAEAGRKILGIQFARMLVNEEGARSGEGIDALHDMRVATRRMRVAFEVFGPFYKKRTVKSYAKSLQRTGRAMRKVRDLDVFLEGLGGYISNIQPNERKEYEPFVTQMDKKRTNGRSRMIRYFDSDRYQAFVQEFCIFLTSPGQGTRRTNSIQPHQVRDLAPLLVDEQLASVRAYDEIIENASISEFHKLRIQIKELRYTIEFFREVLGAESKGVVKDIKKLQDHLGALNDAEVACQIINRFIEKIKKETPLPLHEDLDLEHLFQFLAYKRIKQEDLIASFPKLWQTIMGNAFSEKIAKAISIL